MKSIFISSTFKDMQAERDLLHERIFPRLRRVIAEYGEDVQELDLRWGVDTANMTEEESGRLVLKVCIDAIDRCMPFIIVLLGERYGWIPREDIIASANDMRVNEQYKPGMSITNLEIQYGALKEEEVLDRCVFCMRNPEVMDEIEPEYLGVYEGESAEHKKKLSDLKAKIREKENAIILDYDAKWDADKHKISGLEAFGEELYRILEKMIREEYKDRGETDWREKILLEAKRTKEQYLSSYVERPIEEAQVCENLNNAFMFRTNKSASCNLVTVKGVAGTGKSALMASCVKRIEKIGFPVIAYFSGNPGCQDPKVLKQIMIYELENILQIAHEENEMDLDERLSILDEKAKAKMVVCVIDALDQLYEKEKEPELDFVRLCPNMVFLTSFLDDFQYTVPVGKDLRSWQSEVKKLTKTNKDQMIAYTAGKRGKKLDDTVIQDIIKKESSSNPLYLSNMLQRFFMMDGKEFEAADKLGAGMEGIHRYMEQLLEEMPEKQEEMVLYLLNETMRHFDAEYLYEVMCLIALSKFGLKESELFGLLRIEGKTFAQIEFQQLVSYLYEAFVQKEDGKWTFKHRLFTEAVRKNMSLEEKSNCMELFIQYAKNDEVFLKQEGYYYVLEQKDEYGSEILEHWEEFDLDNLGEWIAELAERDETYEAYFTKLVEVYATDVSAEFWEKKFKRYAYHKKVEAFHIQILRKLIEKEKLNLKMYCDCMGAVMSYCSKYKDYETIKDYIERWELLLDRFTGAEQEYQYALWYSWKGVIAYFDEKDRMKALEYDEKSFEHIERAEQLDPENEEIRLRKICTKDDLYWDYKEAKQELHPELLESELEDLLKHGKELDNSRYTRERIAVLGNLATCYSYSDGGCFNLELVGRYGDEALNLGRKWIKQYPTMENMEIFVRVLNQMTFVAEYQYKYLFDKEAYWYCEKRYETCMTLEAKEALAKKCGNLGVSAVYAWEEYEKNNGYKISVSKSELEKEIPKVLQEAIDLFKGLMEECPENPDYRRMLYNCQLEKAQFEVKNNDYLDVFEQILTEITPVAEELLKTGSDRYIYDAYEVLADSARRLAYYSELGVYADKMLDAASKLLAKKNTKWNRRRVFKSHFYQAMALYENGADAEELLKISYQEYQAMDESEKKEQKLLARFMYGMYPQVLSEKKNIEYAKELLKEGEAVDVKACIYGNHNYYYNLFRWEEEMPASALDFWTQIKNMGTIDNRKKEYIARRLADFLMQSHIDEDEELPIRADYWKYIVRYVKEKNENIEVSFLKKMIRHCFMTDDYKNTIFFIQKMEKLEDEQKLLLVLCQALLANEEQNLEKVKMLIEPAKEMPYCQELLKKEVCELSQYEAAILFAVYELLLYEAAGEEKGQYFENLFVYVKVIYDQYDSVKFEWVMNALRIRLFGRTDLKEIFENISVERLSSIRVDLDNYIRFLTPETERMKAWLYIADRLVDSGEEEHQNKAWDCYHNAFRKDWDEPRKMTTEALELRIRAYEGMMGIRQGYESGEFFKYQLLVLEYYHRTKDKKALEEVLENKRKMSASDFCDDSDINSTRKEVEENTLEFFEELIQMQGNHRLNEYAEYLKNAETMKNTPLYKLVKMKEAVSAYVSEATMENFNQVLEVKGSLDLKLNEGVLELGLNGYY